MAGVTPSGRRDLDLILEVLKKSEHPLAVGEIAAELARLHHRSLTPDQIRYRLGQAPPSTVVSTGIKRGRRYQLAATIGAVATAPTAVGPTASAAERHAERTFELSAEARALQLQTSRPLHERHPVGYDRDWLFSYQPGATWYLPEGTRARLRRIGTPPGAERPAGTFARNMLEYLLIDLAWASSHLEGNTYSLLDTKVLLEFNQRAEGKDADEAVMILNHKRAIEMLVTDDGGLELSAFAIRGLHAALSEGLLPDARFEGRLRDTLVGIGESAYQPTGIPQIIEECFARIVDTASKIPDPFECAFFLLVHLPYLQPFRDVNKRTSRLAANIPLVRANVGPLAFVDVPRDLYVGGLLAVYELRRTELLREVFVWAYERSCARYVVIEQAVPRPDPIRLRYRAELDALVVETVREGRAPDTSVLRQSALRRGVPPADVDAFVEKVLELLLALNDASASRYRLTPAEFDAWRARFRAPPRA